MMSTPPDVPAIASQIYALLQPLDSEARKLVVAGAMTMLGESFSRGKAKDDAGGGDAGDGEHPRKASTWMKQHGITAEQLSHVFHEGEVIAAKLPGTKKTDNTVSMYVLCGIGQLVHAGEPRFTDDAAREACKSHGCFDQANHSAIISRARNFFNGSKQTGWTLTAPGLKQGADLVKQIAKG
jgi:hypothetical protein